MTPGLRLVHPLTRMGPQQQQPQQQISIELDWISIINLQDRRQHRLAWKQFAPLRYLQAYEQDELLSNLLGQEKEKGF